MNVNQTMRWFQEAALVIVLVLVALAALPLLGLVFFFARFALIGALIVGIVALAVSPALRRWLVRVTEPVAHYHGLSVASDVLVHRSHSWIRPMRGQKVLVGVDDLLQQVLGKVDRVTLPAKGASVAAGAPLVTIAHGGREIVVRSPVTGRVSAANSRLQSEPALINTAPYDAGWAVEIEEQTDPARSDLFRWGADAASWFREEVDRVIAFLAPAEATAMAIQDGGPLVEGVAVELDDATWCQFKARFFGDG